MQPANSVLCGSVVFSGFEEKPKRRPETTIFFWGGLTVENLWKATPMLRICRRDTRLSVPPGSPSERHKVLLKSRGFQPMPRFAQTVVWGSPGFNWVFLYLGLVVVFSDLCGSGPAGVGAARGESKSAGIGRKAPFGYLSGRCSLCPALQCCSNTGFLSRLAEKRQPNFLCCH